MDGFLTSEQRARQLAVAAHGSIREVGRLTLAYDPGTGPDVGILVEMTPTATSRLAIRNVRTICR